MANPDLDQLRKVVNKKTKRSRNVKILILVFILSAGIGAYQFITKPQLLKETQNWVEIGTSFVIETFDGLTGSEKTITNIHVQDTPLPEEYVVVQSTAANIRNESHLEAVIVGVVENGVRLLYLRDYQHDGERYWLKVQIANEGQGWVSGNIVSWDEESFALLQEEAKNGNVKAMKELGKRYENGIAMEVNLQEASKWYQLSTGAQ